VNSINLKNDIFISIVVPNFNHETYLHDRLNSILEQTFEHFECIVLDDASDDKSVEIINSFVEKDYRVSSINNLTNSGNTFVQWNKGVKLTKGEFIWLAESDDIANPELLFLLLKPILENDDIVLSYCQSHKINHQGVITGSWFDYTANLNSSQFEKSFVMDGIEFIDKYLIQRNVIPNASAVIFKKSIFDKVGGADEMLKTNSDWLTWLKILCHGKVAFTHNHLNKYRYHPKSVISLANSQDSLNHYPQLFDLILRKKFSNYLNASRILIPRNGIKFNRYSIQTHEGNMGLYYLGKGRFLYGWYLIIRSSIYPKLQSGFIKRALKFL